MKVISLDETDMELENALDKATKELTTLKQQYKDLEEKFDRFKYLETVVSDNGIIDKEYHIIKDALVDGNGKWKKQTDIWCSWCSHPFKTIPVGLPESYSRNRPPVHTLRCAPNALRALRSERGVN